MLERELLSPTAARLELFLRLGCRFENQNVAEWGQDPYTYAVQPRPELFSICEDFKRVFLRLCPEGGGRCDPDKDSVWSKSGIKKIDTLKLLLLQALLAEDIGVGLLVAPDIILHVPLRYSNSAGWTVRKLQQLNGAQTSVLKPVTPCSLKFLRHFMAAVQDQAAALEQGPAAGFRPETMCSPAAPVEGMRGRQRPEVVVGMIAPSRRGRVLNLVVRDAIVVSDGLSDSLDYTEAPHFAPGDVVQLRSDQIQTELVQTGSRPASQERPLRRLPTRRHLVYRVVSLDSDRGVVTLAGKDSTNNVERHAIGHPNTAGFFQVPNAVPIDQLLLLSRGPEEIPPPAHRGISPNTAWTAPLFPRLQLLHYKFQATTNQPPSLLQTFRDALTLRSVQGNRTGKFVHDIKRQMNNGDRIVSQSLPISTFDADPVERMWRLELPRSLGGDMPDKDQPDGRAMHYSDIVNMYGGKRVIVANENLKTQVDLAATDAEEWAHQVREGGV